MSFYFESIETIQKNPEKFSSYYEKIETLHSHLPFDFRDRLKYLRKNMKFTREKLEEFSHVSVQTIKQIENDKNRGYSLETVLALCIGMKLPPEFSFELLKLGGFYIENYIDKKYTLYCFILRNFYNQEIDFVNEFLKRNEFSPLN